MKTFLFALTAIAAGAVVATGVVAGIELVIDAATASKKGG